MRLFACRDARLLLPGQRVHHADGGIQRVQHKNRRRALYGTRCLRRHDDCRTSRRVRSCHGCCSRRCRLYRWRCLRRSRFEARHCRSTQPGRGPHTNHQCHSSASAPNRKTSHNHHLSESLQCIRARAATAHTSQLFAALAAVQARCSLTGTGSHYGKTSKTGATSACLAYYSVSKILETVGIKAHIAHQMMSIMFIKKEPRGLLFARLSEVLSPSISLPAFQGSASRNPRTAGESRGWYPGSPPSNRPRRSRCPWSRSQRCAAQ